MSRSITLRLLVLLLITVTLTAFTSIVLSYIETRHEINELFDAQLAQEARIIQSSFLGNLDSRDPLNLQKLLEQNSVIIPQYNHHHDDEESRYGHAYERKVAFQIWHRDKGLLLRSLSAPTQPMTEEVFSYSTIGFKDIIHNNNPWRVFSTWDRDHKILVQTAEDYEVRNELIHEISEQLISTSLLFLPVLIIVILLAVHKGLQPLKQLEYQIRHRHPDNLDAIDIASVPDEIEGTVKSLNKLLARIKQAFSNERQFTDDAAHELRTPLSALKTHAQLALRSTNDHDKQAAIEHIILAVDRMTHLVQQLLDLSRIGNEKISINLQNINVLQAVTDTISLVAAKLADKNIELVIDIDEADTIQSDASLLGMLLLNLIDNAVKYSPADSSINLSTLNEAGQYCVVIRDHGPGIAPELHHRVFDRFYRVVGSHVSGCGLGLSITQRCAVLLDGEIKLFTHTNPQGLEVQVCFNQVHK